MYKPLAAPEPGRSVAASDSRHIRWRLPRPTAWWIRRGSGQRRWELRRLGLALVKGLSRAVWLARRRIDHVLDPTCRKCLNGVVTAPRSQHAPLSPFRIAPFFRTRIWGFHDLSPWFD